MPNINKIKEAIQGLDISDEILSQFDCFTFVKGACPEPVIALIDKMDELLTNEQILAVMEKQGCCKSGWRDKECKAFGKKYSDMPIEEKLTLIPNIPHFSAPRLNEDGTITITFNEYQNGVHTGKTTCSCGLIKKLKQPFSVSPTFCGCCAGHVLYHHQNALGVKLRLKEINSSPLNTNGEKPCEFTFEIVN